MVYNDRNLAYDLRLFEDDVYASVTETRDKQDNKRTKRPEKKNIEHAAEKKRHKVIKRRKNNFFMISAVVAFALAVVVVVGMIIHGQVQLTELNQQIANANRSLEEKQSLYTQIEMKVDASVSTAVVEDFAKKQLGMSKVANSQKEFVSLSQGDKVEITKSEDKGVIEALAEAISSLWS